MYLAASAHGTLSAFYIRSQTLTGVGVLCGCRAGRTFCCRLWASCGLCTFFLQHFFTGIPSLAVVFAGSLCSCAVDLFWAFLVDLLGGSTSVVDVYCLCSGGTLYCFLAHLLAHALLLSDTFDSTARLTWCFGSRQIAKGRVLYRRLQPCR